MHACMLVSYSSMAEVAEHHLHTTDQILMHTKAGLHPGHRQDKSAHNCQMHQDQHTDITGAPETGECDSLSRRFTLPKERRGRFNKALGFI